MNAPDLKVFSERKTAEWRDYPFVVHFAERMKDGKSIPYTGTRITPGYILTAAHNLFDGDRTQGVNVDDLTITMYGAPASLTGRSDICPTFFCHPRYIGSLQNDPRDFDVALIALKKQAPCIPQNQFPMIRPDDLAAVGDNTGAHLVGWGDSNPGPLWHCPDTRFRRWYDADRENPHQFLTNANTKRGDSGGPLLVRQQDKSWAQIGIHSARDRKLRIATRIGHPEIYEWICRTARIPRQTTGFLRPLELGGRK